MQMLNIFYTFLYWIKIDHEKNKHFRTVWRFQGGICNPCTIDDSSWIAWKVSTEGEEPSRKLFIEQPISPSMIWLSVPDSCISNRIFAHNRAIDSGGWDRQALTGDQADKVDFLLGQNRIWYLSSSCATIWIFAPLNTSPTNTYHTCKNKWI